MDDDSLALSSAADSRDGDVDRAEICSEGEHPRVLACALVTQRGADAARPYRSEPDPLSCDVGMADGVDTAVDAVEAPGRNTALDRVGREARREKLTQRDHAVLAGGHPADEPIGLAVAAFLAHRAIKAPTP
jgi:hypothetical protein